MKIEKFKVLLYLKRSGTDKNGKTPIMGRITVNRSVWKSQTKICTPNSTYAYHKTIASIAMVG